MTLFLSIAILAGLAAVFGFINERFLRLQTTIGLMLLALVMSVALALLKQFGGLDFFGWEQDLVSGLDLGDTLLNGVLCFMLFAGSAGVRIKRLGEYRWTIASLAIISTGIASVLIALVLGSALPLFGVEIGLAYAFVFGALISPTDPIASLAILKAVDLPKPLETIINGESLFNDGVGVVLFTIGLAVAQGEAQPTASQALTLFLREVLGGIGLGLLLSLVMHFALIRTRNYGNQLLITLSTVALGYGVAERVEVSGPIAVVVAGLVVGSITIPKLAEEETKLLGAFWSGVDQVLNSMLFVMIGLSLVVVHSVSWSVIVFTTPLAILVCLIARAVSVYVPIAGLGAAGILDSDRWGLTRLLTWAGLRGGLALALALSLPDSDAKPTILSMTSGVVAFSILVQGSTIGRLFNPAFLRRLLKSS